MEIRVSKIKELANMIDEDITIIVDCECNIILDD